MKKLKLLLLTFICTLIMPTLVNASSGSIKVTSSSTVVQGNRVTVTVTLSSSSSLGSWQMDLNYDKNYLQLVSSTAESGGSRMVGYASNGSTKSKTYTFAFKTIKSGTTRVSVSSYLAYDYENMSEMNLTSSSKSIRIMTQAELEATYSKDNNLKSLSVEGYELDKTFHKDALEYTVKVPTGTTSVKIKATENDSKASVTGAGEIEVTEGLNTIPIIVTAQNGSEKTYTLTINVEDLNPITVSDINGESYTIIKNALLLTAPSTFVESKITINETEIPTYRNNAADLTLVGLKDNAGTISLFIYENNEYKPYNEMNLKNYLLIPTSFTNELDLIKTTVTINNETIDAYKYSENSEFVIITAKSLEDGKTSLYLYDTINKTASRYDDTYIKETNETLKNYTYVILAFAGALLLMLITIFILLGSLRKKQKKIKKFVEKQEAKIEATIKLNDVISEVKKISEKEKTSPKQDSKGQKQESKEPKEEAKEEKISEKKLSKKELKKLKKQEIKDQERKEEIEVKEIKVKEDKSEEAKAPEENSKDTDDSDEIYSLFDDDKKKKKKK